MQKLELLAPAQNLSCAISAINSGADAVYIGADDFSARKSAKNSLSDIEKIVNFAHLFNVKVYVTINTILNDSDIEKCTQLIKDLYEIKVDALIIQDFAILNLALQNKIPPILLHISTQADNRDIEKIKFFENIGIKRVILPRETNLEDIKKINKFSKIELEHFISGALCVCYSGCCYLSYFIGKRSANKGDCAQPCRKKYSLVDNKGKNFAKNKYLLSLKDNNLSNHLDKLINAGVVSFKIEGRLKSEEYVKNQVLYFHNLLKNYPRISKGEITADFSPDISKTFNRGFCDDYLFNKKDNIYNFSTPKSIGEKLGAIDNLYNDYFILKTDKTVSSQDGLCTIQDDELKGFLVNKAIKIKGGYKIYPNKKVFLKKNSEIFRNLDFEFNKILKNSKTKRKLNINFIITENKIEITDEFKNKSSVELTDFETAQNFDKMKQNYVKSLSKTSDSPFSVKNIIFKTEKIKFVPISILNDIRKTLIENLKTEILSKYKTKKQKPLKIAKFHKSIGDYTFNVTNQVSKEFYSLCGCEIKEYSVEKTNSFKDKHLMTTKHCLKKIFLGCDKKIEDKSLFLVDEKGVKYPLSFDCASCNMIINSP